MLRGREDQWVVWCGTNIEQDQITAGLGSDCVSIYGRMTPEEKVALESRWLAGEVKTIVTKPSIYGFGVNWQHCSQMIFVGLNDSYESYYQSIRRCYRYGQTRVVHAHVVLSDLEGQIASNVRRKETEAGRGTGELVRAIQESKREIVA
jgi:superfamily II DNA helicase RecQ